ncbi:hypothetical protein CsSME_00042681 [Camellia sinensis var. sinensis]
MATSVTVVNGHTDQGCKLKSGLKYLNHGKQCFSSSSSAGSGGDAADLRPLASMVGSDLGGFMGTSNGEERRKQADDSLRQVIRLVSAAGTGFFYVKRKNPKRIQTKLEFRKYDPRVNRHVLFTEAKMK